MCKDIRSDPTSAYFCFTIIVQKIAPCDIWKLLHGDAFFMYQFKQCILKCIDRLCKSVLIPLLIYWSKHSRGPRNVYALILNYIHIINKGCAGDLS